MPWPSAGRIGDLVKWQAVYDDYLVKDIGLGIIMGIKEYKYEKNPVGNEIEI